MTVPSAAHEGLLDTSVFVARESGRPLDIAALPDYSAVSVVTVAELLAGVLVAADTETRAQRLKTLTAARSLTVVDVDHDVAEAWAALRVRLREEGRSMTVNDSWIAATALAYGVPVVTQDDDFDDVPDLQVVRV